MKKAPDHLPGKIVGGLLGNQRQRRLGGGMAEDQATHQKVSTRPVRYGTIMGMAGM